MAARTDCVCGALHYGSAAEDRPKYGNVSKANWLGGTQKEMSVDRVRWRTLSVAIGLIVSAPLTPALGQPTSSSFACSCTKDEKSGLCRACRAARREDCACQNVSPPPAQCPAGLDASKVQLKHLQAENSKLAGKINTTSQAIDEFERNTKDCPAVKSSVDSFGDADVNQIGGNYLALESLLSCAYGLRGGIETQKREHPTNLRFVQQLKDINNLIIEVSQSKQSLVDAGSLSKNLIGKVASTRQQCKWK